MNNCSEKNRKNLVFRSYLLPNLIMGKSIKNGPRHPAENAWEWGRVIFDPRFLGNDAVLNLGLRVLGQKNARKLKSAKSPMCEEGNSHHEQN